MTQSEENHMNGFPSWPQLFEIVTNIQDTMSGVHSRLGGLEKGQDLAIEQTRIGLHQVHNHIDNLKGRLSTLEANHMPRRKSLWERMGMSIKEIAGLAFLAAMGIAGMLEPSLIARWLF